MRAERDGRSLTLLPETAAESALSRFETALAAGLLEADDPDSVALREQLRAARVVRRELTGVGFFVDLEVPGSSPIASTSRRARGSVLIRASCLDHDAGAVLFVVDGRLATIEGFAYGDRWTHDDARSVLLDETPAVIEVMRP